MDEIPFVIDAPRNPPLCTFVFAHGAGAGLHSTFMEEMAQALRDHSIRVIRFEFPYMRRTGSDENLAAGHGDGPRERGRGRARPDPPTVLEETWMEAAVQAGDPSTLVIGGKSMGGRIASMVADRLGVRGLVCMGYPFHPSGAPAILRVAHLAGIRTPTLILQGTRDSLGSKEDVSGYLLSPAIHVVFLPDGDHSFKPRWNSGRTYGENFQRGVEETVEFCKSLFS